MAQEALVAMIVFFAGNPPMTGNIAVIGGFGSMESCVSARPFMQKTYNTDAVDCVKLSPDTAVDEGP